MVNSIMVYFLGRLGFYFVNFFDVYLRGGFNSFHLLFWRLFFRLEKRLAFFVNLRYFTIPFWQEYSWASYFLSIPIRSLRIALGAICLFIFSVFFWLIYLAWILAPVYLVFKMFSFSK